MKASLLLVIILGVTIVAFATNAQDSRSKIKTKTSQTLEHEKEDEHGHGKEDEHGHGKEDEHGHGKEDEHGDGEEDEHGHGEGKAVGQGKAILEVSEKMGFKLSKEAFRALDVKLMDYDHNNFLISNDTLVSFQNKTGIYRYRDGYFKFVPVSIKDQKKGNYTVFSPSLQPGDKIVTSPVGLIRITDVYSTDTAEYGHGH